LRRQGAWRCRDEGERERRLPAQVLTAMHEARLFRMYIPKALDGLEIDPITSMIVVEEIARPTPRRRGI
jgi:alkylation response protein AidB-like acyl-CoA dehydrogenase